MAEKKTSTAKTAKTKHDKAPNANNELLQALPYVRDTREEEYRSDKGLHWWHVSNTDYWHQDLSIGEAFCDKSAVLHGSNPEEVTQALRFALGDMVKQGRCGGIEQGFLNRLVHYASIGMALNGAVTTSPVMTART